MVPAATAQVSLTDPVGMDEWRSAARSLLQAAVPPESVIWTVGQETDLFAAATVSLPPRAAPPAAAAPPATVPRRFLELAKTVLAHRDARRHALLYRLLWRIAYGERSLLDDATDADVLLVRGWARAVQRDVHKMKAFVRFREVAAEDGSIGYVAWFEPEQLIVERAAPFFVRRFASMHWSILTPDRCVHWDGERLRFTGGARRGDAPSADGLDDLWREYYASTFNPARLKVAAMTREMPKRYWKNLPEARLIPGLVRDATARSEAMVARPPTPPRRRPR